MEALLECWSVVVSCCSVIQSCPTLCNPMDCSIPGFPICFTISWNLSKLMSTESMMSSNHLILCQPLLLMPSIFPSIKVFSNESALCIRWSKYWTLPSILPINIQSWFPLGFTGLISLLSKGLSKVFSTVWKYQFFDSASFMVQGNENTDKNVKINFFKNPGN